MIFLKFCKKKDFSLEFYIQQKTHTNNTNNNNKNTPTKQNKTNLQNESEIKEFSKKQKLRELDTGKMHYMKC